MNLTLPLQLMLTRGIGDAFIHRFSDYVLRHGVDEVERILQSTDDLCSVFSLKAEIANALVHSSNEANMLAVQLKKSGIEWVSLLDQAYPARLRSILGKTAPPILFFRGNINLCQEHSVGFCGARAASEKGLSVTEKCCRQLVERNIVVVSGYANGVDIVSHRTALQEGGKTVMVLAEGICHFHEKPEIQGLFRPNNHLILSPFPPNLPWMGRNAMRRNAIIIALSDAMILVESGLTGGTYAAGEECLRRQIPLFVIDFASPPGPSAEANPKFIQRGGIPIRGTQMGIPKLERLFQAVDESPISTGYSMLVLD